VSDIPPDKLTPYKGLVPYAEQDAPFFFGREREQAIITANLMAARLTVLYGPSGAGKSSVLRAGVEHTLREHAQRNLEEHGEPEYAVIVFNNWRDDPVAGLSRVIEETVKQTLSTMGQADDGPPMPNDLVENLEARTQRINGELLIILDQFEEYFLYHAQEDGEGTFAVEFPRAVNRAGLRVNFLVALREDALSKLDRFKGRVPNLFDNYLRIGHLAQAAARDAIEKPLEEYNRRQTTEAERVTIEPALVDAVLSQVQTGRVTLARAGSGSVGDGHQPADATIETSYLQLVMTRLWVEEIQAGSHTLQLATLDRLEGAEHIVRTHLDSVMAGLSPDEVDIAAEVFRYLVTPSGTKIAYTVKDLTDYVGVSGAQLTPVLERLAGSGLRILRTVDSPPDQPRETRYEIFHDVLAPAILDWRARYMQEKEKRELEQRLAEEAEKQRASELEAARRRELEAEAKTSRRLRRLAMALVAVSLIAIGAAVLAVIGWIQTESARVQLLNVLIVPQGSPFTLAELQAIPLAPTKTVDAPAGGSSQATLNAARIWNKYGGLIGPLAYKIGIDPGVAVAIIATESIGRGSDSTGRMIIRFENHLFWFNWGKANADTYNQLFQFDPNVNWQGHKYRPTNTESPWLDVHANQDSEWAAFALARGLNSRAAILSISMGLVPLLGSDYYAIGYDTPEAMFTAFSADERFQLVGFFNFIKYDQRQITALQNQDFVGFARIYNGPGQPDYYGGLMKDVADGFNSLRPTTQ
jgi:hypothetical protein